MEKLTFLPTNNEIILQNSGLEIINNFLKKYSKNESIILSLFKALENISIFNEDHRNICLKMNFVELIENILKENETNKEIEENGKLTIESLKAQRQYILPDPQEILKIVFTYKIAEKKSLISKENKEFLMNGRICKL